MSNSSNVTEQDLINLLKLAEQQKEQRALKIKSRIIKQTHDVKLAENLSPITKKLDEVNKSTQESLSPIIEKLDTINESVKESNSENNKEIITTPSILLQDLFKSLAEAPTALKLNEEKDGNLSILGTPIKYLGGDKYKYMMISMNLILKYTKLYHVHLTRVKL